MSLYEFHKASIHERRFAAKLFAATPLLVLIGYFALLAYGLHKPHVLLVTCAILNASTWYWLASTVILGITGVIFASEALQRARVRRPRFHLKQSLDSQANVERQVSVSEDTTDKVMHLIVLPNMKEDEGMLAETLSSLAEADECESFCIVLAMEEREANSMHKGQRLKQRFQHMFGGITVTVHPANLQQPHLDESSDAEVPGKASNLKWAVPNGYTDFVKSGLIKSRSSVILTVSDADCIFHPGYFASVSKEFNMLRENPGNDHLWTMYQAPQLPCRNYFSAVAPCRIWGYVSSAYEFGGVTSLSFGGSHMTFSGYSLPLQLALDAGAWDGDVVAEDHHAFLKCFMYSALASVEASGDRPVCVPQLKVHPIYLPVKATSVQAETYASTCINRWCQAKRHAQGVSELSYAMLATWDAMRTLPWKHQSFAFYYQAFRYIGRLFCMHLMPTCQGVGLLALSVVWILHGGRHPLCPKNFSLMYLTTIDHRTPHHLVCGLAGAWMTYVPMFVLTSIVIIANYLFLKVVFLREKRKNAMAESIWHAQDGGAPHGPIGYQHLLAFLQTTFDCTLLLSAVMVPYGFFANAAAYVECAFNGNRIKYHVASKPLSGYGAVDTRIPAMKVPTETLATASSKGSDRITESSIEEPLNP